MLAARTRKHITPDRLHLSKNVVAEDTVSKFDRRAGELAEALKSGVNGQLNPSVSEVLIQRFQALANYRPVQNQDFPEFHQFTTALGYTGQEPWAFGEWRLQLWAGQIKNATEVYWPRKVLKNAQALA